MEQAFNKLNYYALTMCILMPKEISIDKALREMGIAEKIIRPRVQTVGNKKVFEADLDNIEKLYWNEDKTMKEIAVVYDCSMMAICNLFKKHGRKTKGRGGCKYGSKTATGKS